MGQLTLPLSRPPAMGRDDIIVSGCNREAVARLDAWPGPTGGSLALVGPEGSGKSHLALAWAARTSAFVAEVSSLDLRAIPARPVLLEIGDSPPADTDLFHLLNRAEAGASLLITARLPPRLWGASLPDLRSRLNALATVELAAPDDLVLEGVIRKLFDERLIRPDDDLIAYLLKRIERSVPAARRVVDELNAVGGSLRREVNRALAREILDAGDKTGELFE